MEDWKGRVIRGYELRELLGVGGFGMVYSAYQATVKREVAIKIILPESANKPHFIRNFEREAELIARLEHPHIVPLYDYWRDPTGAYIVMRLLRGGSVRDLIKREGAFSIEKTAKMLEQIGDALSIAHSKGVIHQDMKTANILLDELGNAYLSDFGIAKDLARRDEIQDPSEQKVYGSPEYMAPEQILNISVDARADIYSLGVMLFEMLTGQKPFVTDDDVKLIQKQLYERLPMMHSVRTEIPPNLDIVVQRATDKNPKLRYSNPREMALNFRQFVTLNATPTINSFETPTTDHLESKPKLALVNPYKGLRAFFEADAQDFFGREKMIERLYRRMLEPGAEARLLVVVGPSGSGKSSVVRAGLLPALRENLPKWFIASMTPSAKPFAQLAEAIASVASHETPDLTLQLKSGVEGIHQALQVALGAGKHQLVLLIDQFEELFTQVQEESERQRFIDSLLFALQAENSRLRVILTLRADFYDRPLLYANFSEWISKRTEVVSPLAGDELERAIVKPAERVGLTIEDGLVSEIITEVSKEPGVLPLLQFALTELYNQSLSKNPDQEDPMLTIKAYHVSGGVTGAMTRRAETLFEQMNDDVKLITERLFLRLVTPGEGVEDTRRRALLSELLSLVDQPHVMQTVIDQFGHFRLLSFDRDASSREPTVEIAHEALIRSWGRLRGWLRENRRLVMLQRELFAETNRWLQANRDQSYLPVGKRLNRLEELLDARAVPLSPDERSFLQSGVALRTLNERIRKGLFALALFAALFFALLAMFATEQSRAAQVARSDAEQARDLAELSDRESRSRELAIRALTGQSHFDWALLTSVEALQTADTFEARNTLLTTLQAQPRLKGLLQGQQDHIRAIAYSPDGRWIASAGRDQQVMIWDLQTGSLVQQFQHNERVNAVMFSHDNRWVISGGADDAVRIWDRETGQPIGDPLILTDDVWALALSPDGRVLIAAGADDLIYRWDLNTHEPIGTPLQEAGDIYTLAYHPNGEIFASAGMEGGIRLWDAQTGERIGEPLTAHRNWIWEVEFSPDGNLLASTGNDQTLIFWDVIQRQPLGEPLLAHEGLVRTLDFDPSGRLLVTGGADGRLIFWDVLTRRPISAINHLEQSRVWGVDFNPDGTVLASVGETDAVILWDWQARSVLAAPFQGHDQPIAGLAFAGESLLSLTNPIESELGLNVLRQWNLADQTYTETRLTEATPRLVTAFALDPVHLTVATGDIQGHVYLDTPSNPTVDLKLGNAIIFALAFDPTGDRLAIGDATGQITLWQREGDQWTRLGEPLIGHQDRILTLAFNRDGTRLASGSRDTSVRLWHVETGQAVFDPLIGHNQAVVSLAFHTDRLASGGRDNAILLWDLQSGQALQTLNVHTDWVNSLTFSADGRYLASGSRDQTVILWDMRQETVTPIGQPFVGHQTSVNAVVFTPDQRLLVSGGEDGLILAWSIDPHDWQILACQIANRDLNPMEWRDLMREWPYRPTCSEEIRS
ncbi:MAG: protein kinase [Anaerolineae bacterium]|nr:protein kinase [Anaerolineae bacterium]